MSLQFRIADQVLHVDDKSATTESIVHKYDAFLNLLCANQFAFQREAVREALRFLISDKYADLERLARENWDAKQEIQHRHESLEAYLDKMPLRARKAVSLDLATGTGKSFVLYALAAIALAEALVDRVLVLCPSLTIEEGLLEKFSMLAGNPELSGIMKELGAGVAIPGVKRGNVTTNAGDICIENIHAVYDNAGSSIADSFGQGKGGRTLVLNDEAHHLFSPPDKALKEWLKFLLNTKYDFHYIVNVTGTAYTNVDYFPDVIYRYGLKRAIEDKVVKKPNYKQEETYKRNDWQKTYKIHQQNRHDYGKQVKPITIVVTQEIARCVEVWSELIEFVMKKEKISRADAEKKAIWITSGLPSSGDGKARVGAVYGPRNGKDSPEKRRKENLTQLREVDETENPVEWIVSVSMLTEGWDVKNVFQIVPHDSRAFNSKLLIAQVLGRGLRMPAGLEKEPLVTINNHEAWSEEIGNLLKEILEVENTLSWGYDLRRSEYVFPLHNLRYQPQQTTLEVKVERAGEPNVKFLPQDKWTTEYMTFSVAGSMAVEIEHRDVIGIEDAVKLMRLFLREKNEEIAKVWPKKRLRNFIVSRLTAAGYDPTYLSKENRLRLQQSFGPMFRELGKEHPRMSQVAKEIEAVDLTRLPRQSFSESSLKESGAVWSIKDEIAPFSGQEIRLWEQYQKFRKQLVEYGEDASEQAKAIGGKLKQVELTIFKSPWNIHYASYEPERKFSDLLFNNADLFDSFVRMPNQGAYSFPYSYKPIKAGKTHVANENFNPDYFIRVRGKNDVLVVEVKMEGDDSNRNKAKYRDGQKHFETLNSKLTEKKEPWRYHFYFLSPEDYTSFFGKVREGNYAGWMSGLMQELA
jgi:type III restriction enzyme